MTEELLSRTARTNMSAMTWAIQDEKQNAQTLHSQYIVQLRLQQATLVSCIHDDTPCVALLTVIHKNKNLQNNI